MTLQWHYRPHTSELKTLQKKQKSYLKINKLVHQGNVIDDGLGMANAMNSFFVNIGSTVEAKIPKGNKPYSSYLGVKNESKLLVPGFKNGDL